MNRAENRGIVATKEKFMRPSQFGQFEERIGAYRWPSASFLPYNPRAQSVLYRMLEYQISNTFVAKLNTTIEKVLQIYSQKYMACHDRTYRSGYIKPQSWLNLPESAVFCKL
jgi:hypothetical protein